MASLVFVALVENIGAWLAGIYLCLLFRRTHGGYRVGVWTLRNIAPLRLSVQRTDPCLFREGSGEHACGLDRGPAEEDALGGAAAAQPSGGAIEACGGARGGDEGVGHEVGV